MVKKNQICHKLIKLYLEASRFELAAMIRMLDLKYDLISALVERWRSETHTFHLMCGECTITLEYVALQLKPPINGIIVTGVSTLFNLATLSYDLLGLSPDDGGNKLKTLRFSWLKANFEYLPSIATKCKVMCTI